MPCYAAVPQYSLLYRAVSPPPQLTLGASSLIVSSLPAILTPAPGSDAARSLAAFHDATTRALQHNASVLSARLREVPGLRVVAPQV